MRILITALVLLVGVASAHAGYTCSRVGNYTYCTGTGDDSGSNTTCSRVGNYTYCN